MLKSWQYWIVSAIAALCLVLVVVNIALVHGNEVRRLEVQRRGAYIQQSIQLQGLYQNMIKALADLSVRNKDEQLKDLLAREGINVTVTPPAAPSLTEPAAPAAGKAGAERHAPPRGAHR